MPNPPRSSDDLNQREKDAGLVGSGQSAGRGMEDLGAPKLDMPENEAVYLQGQPEEEDRKSEARDRAEEEAKERLKKKLKGEKEGEGEEGAEGAEAGEGAPEAGAEPEATTPEGTPTEGAPEGGAPEGAGPQASAAPEAGAPEAAGGVPEGAAGASEAGAAGAEAGAEGAGAAGTTGAGAATGAGEAAAGGAEAAAGAAGAAGGEAAAGAAGAAATGAAATGAAAGAEGTAVATGATVAATTGGETMGIGAAVGAAIVVVAVVGGFVLKHRKLIAELGAVIFVGILLLITSFLNALKPIASTVQTAQKFLSPVANIIEERSTPIFARFISGASSVALGQDQQNVAQNSNNGGHVLAATTDGPVTAGKLKDLFDLMRKDGFEQDLKEKFQLEFKRANGGGIDLIWRGKSIGVGHNTTEIEGLLRNNFGDLQRVLDEEVNAWSWGQHIKVARTMKADYKIPLSIPGAADAFDPSQLTEVVKYQMQTILSIGLANITTAITCFVSGLGCNDAGIPVTNTGDLAKPDYQDNADSAVMTATQKAYDNNLKNITPANDYLYPRLDDSAGDQVRSQLNQKAVGILGWLDMAASMNAISQMQAMQHLPSVMRESQAGALATWYTSAINQMIAGDSSSQASSLITRNYANIEDSQAYNFVAYDDASRGQAMADDKKVNSIIAEPFKFIYNALLVNNPIIQTGMKFVFDAWLVLRHTPATIIINIASHTPLGDLVNRYLAVVFQKVGLETFIVQTLGISSEMLLPVCDPADASYNYLNCYATGMHASANRACLEQFACVKLTLAQEVEERTADTKRQQASLATMPLQKRLFDQAVPNSFVNVASMQSPLPIKATSNVASFVQSIFGAVWNAPNHLASLSSAPARAAASDSSFIDGQETYGIDIGTLLSTPLAGELSTANAACPQTAIGQGNMCVTDSSVLDVWLARFSFDPNYGQAASAAPTGPGSPNGPAGNWNLSFADDFNGSAVDTSLWSYQSSAESDWSSKPFGTGNLGNKQLEFDQPGNCSVSGGALSILAKPQSITSQSGQKYNWTSCLLTTKGYNFRYGYIETSARFPPVKGFWPGFWTWQASGQNLPANGETDGFEYYSDNNQYIDLTQHNGSGGACRYHLPFDPTTGFHTYGVDIEPSGTVWYIDGKNVCSTKATSPGQTNIILDNFVFRDIQPAAGSTGTTQFDYVRAWQH